jgi:hypothetical protein
VHCAGNASTTINDGGYSEDVEGSSVKMVTSRSEGWLHGALPAKVSPVKTSTQAPLLELRTVQAGTLRQPQTGR